MSTPHQKGEKRKPGTSIHVKIMQSEGLNLLPVKSGHYKCRIEVKYVKVGKRQKRVITVILRDCVNLV